MKNKTFIDSCFILLLIYIVKLISKEQTNPTQNMKSMKYDVYQGLFIWP